MSATEALRPEYILIRVNGPSAAFIEEEAARVNSEYNIISESERQELHQLYEESVVFSSFNEQNSSLHFPVHFPQEDCARGKRG